jgi:hypothetical protein
MINKQLPDYNLPELILYILWSTYRLWHPWLTASQFTFEIIYNIKSNNLSPHNRFTTIKGGSLLPKFLSEVSDQTGESVLGSSLILIVLGWSLILIFLTRPRKYLMSNIIINSFVSFFLKREIIHLCFYF